MVNQEVQQPSEAKPRFFYGYIVVIAAFFIMVAIYGTYHAFGVFFKPVLTEFGWTRATTSGAFSLSIIMHGLLGIVMGRLNDRLGPRIVMSLCGFLLGLGYLLMSQISTLWQLYLFYGVIIGIGMGGAWVPLTSTVARWFVARRSMMTGTIIAGLGIGGLIVPPVATHLISTYGWRTSYIILGSIVLVVVVLAAQFLKRDPSKVGQVPYGENKRGENKLKLGTEGFSLKEAACTRQFWVVFTMLFCFGFCAYFIMVHIAPHAIDLGISVATAANILATIGGLGIIGNIVLGNAADRIGNRWVFIIGFILMAAALLSLVPATKVWMLYLFAAVFGFAVGGCAASESPIVARLFGLRSHGLILGVAIVGFSIGAAVGPFLAGYMFDVTGSYQGAFLVCAALGVIGLILAALLTSTTGERGKIKTI